MTDFLRGGEKPPGKGKMNASRQIEDEANYFAMCLLMPRDLVTVELGKIRQDNGFEETVEALAQKFKVSVPMMTLRLSQLELIR